MSYLRPLPGYSSERLTDHDRATHWSESISSVPESRGGLDGPNGVYSHSPWVKYFGLPNRPLPPGRYERENEDLPDAYIGVNNHASNLVISTITSLEMDLVSRVLPWYREESNDLIKWDTVIFNDHMLNRRPEESVSRLLTYERSEDSASYVSYGIAMMLESGFYKTPVGAMTYAMNIKQISNATVETACLGAAIALLNAPPCKDSEAELSGRGLSAIEFRRLLGTERDMFMIFQKTEQGMLLGLDELKRRLSARGVSADYVVLPAGAMKFVQHSRAELKYNYLSGNVGLPSQPNVPKGLTYTESRPFRIGEHRPNFDPFFQNISIGSFYTMLADDTRNIPPEYYRTCHRDVFAWSEDRDDYHRHRISDVFRASGLVDANGDFTQIGMLYFATYPSWWDYLENVNFAHSVRDAVSRTSDTLLSFVDFVVTDITGPNTVDHLDDVTHIGKDDDTRKKKKKKKKGGEGAGFLKKFVDYEASWAAGCMAKAYDQWKNGSLDGYPHTERMSTDYIGQTAAIGGLKGGESFNRLIGQFSGTTKELSTSSNAVVVNILADAMTFQIVPANIDGALVPDEQRDTIQEVNKFTDSLASLDLNEFKKRFAVIRKKSSNFSSYQVPLIKMLSLVSSASVASYGTVSVTTILNNLNGYLNEKNGEVYRSAVVWCRQDPKSDLDEKMDTESHEFEESGVGGKVVVHHGLGVDFVLTPDVVRLMRIYNVSEEELVDLIQAEKKWFTLLPKLWETCHRPIIESFLVFVIPFLKGRHRRRYLNQARLMLTAAAVAVRKHFMQSKSSSIDAHARRMIIRLMMVIRNSVLAMHEDEKKIEELPVEEKLRELGLDDKELDVKDAVAYCKKHVDEIVKEIETKGSSSGDLEELFGSESKDAQRAWTDDHRIKSGRIDMKRAKDKGLGIKDLYLEAKTADTVDKRRLLAESVLRVYPVESGRVLAYFLERDIPLPVSFLLFAPHGRFECGTSVMCRSGSELGNTYWGWPDFQLSKDTSQKMIYGHFTVKLKPLVRNPRLLVAGRDMYVRDYLGGYGHTYWNYSEEDNIKYAQGDLDGRDLFVVAVPPDYRPRDDYMDLTGFFDPTVFGGDDVVHYPSASLYAGYWNWRHEDSPFERTYDVNQVPRYNTIMWAGAQVIVNYKGMGRAEWDKFSLNKGHIGDRVYPGCGQVRRGKAMHLLPVRGGEPMAVTLTA